jgi:hypothetical protein
MVIRNLKVDTTNGGIKKTKILQDGKDYEAESIPAEAGEAQQVRKRMRISWATR